jgi:PKD repeat protein
MTADRPARVIVLGLALTLAAAAGCRESTESSPPAPAGRDVTAPAADKGAYELDVIVDAEPDEGEPPLTVHFEGYVDEDEGGPWRYAWDFGDGTTSKDQNPTHTYEAVGDYTATLKATDQRGNTGSDEVDVFVDADE